MMRRTALVLAAGLVVTGCGSGLLPSSDSRPDELAEIKSRVLELQRAAAMTQVEIDRLRQQVAVLQSRLSANGVPPAATRIESPPLPPVAQPPAVRPRVRPLPPPVEVTDLESGSEAPAPRPVDPAPAPPAATSAPLAAAAAAPVAPTVPVSDAAQALYDRGYTLYHQGRYVDAEAGFRRFLQAYADTALSDNAQYWIGESRFARGDFEGALAAFREVVQRYPGGNKVADSLLKSADCLQRMGDEESARSTYDEVIRRFPGSAAAAMAEERRGQM